MDYLIGLNWPLWVIGFVVSVIIVDEIVYRWERKNLPPEKRRHVRKPDIPDPEKKPVLFVITKESDKILFSGSEAAVFDWLMINYKENPENLGVYKKGDLRVVPTSYFKMRYMKRVGRS